MPKFIPGYEDMYETKPCFICGNPVLDEDKPTCSEECKHRLDDYIEDMNYFMSMDLMRYEEDL